MARDPRASLGITADDAERLDLDEFIFRARALAQAHPMSRRAYRYLNRIVARERTDQPVPELGIWAGNALTVGYCARAIEESDTDGPLDAAPTPLPDDLDEAAIYLAGIIRTEGALPYLLYPEEDVVAGLDRMIAGEVERRLGHWEGQIDERAWAEIEEYIAWWVIKGYALRVVDPLITQDEQDLAHLAESD